MNDCTLLPMSYYPQLLPTQPLRRFYLTVNGQRLLNLITLERLCLFSAMFMLMVPVVLRRFFYVYTFDPFLFALYAIWFIRAALHQRSEEPGLAAPNKIRVTPTEMVALLLLGWIVLSTFTALNRYTSLLYLLLLFRAGLFYFYFRQNTGTVISVTDLRRIIVVLLLVQCVIAIVQFVTNSRFGSVNDYFGEPVDHPNAYFQSSIGRTIRVVGTFHNPNLLGNWIILLVPFVYASLYFNVTRRRKFYFVLLGGCIIALFLTFSRSGWVSFFLACMVVFLRLTIGNMRQLFVLLHRFLRYSVLLLLLLTGAFLLLSLYVDNLSLTLIQERFRSVTGGGEWRMGYIDLSFQLFTQEPLRGIGLGNFAEALYRDYGGLHIPAILNTGGGFSTVHNIWLQFLAETGLAGALLLILATLGMMLQFWQLYSRRMAYDPVHLVLAIWLIGGFYGFIINASFEAVFFHQSILMLLFSMLGIGTALKYYQRRARNRFLAANPLGAGAVRKPR